MSSQVRQIYIPSRKKVFAVWGAGKGSYFVFVGQDEEAIQEALKLREIITEKLLSLTKEDEEFLHTWEKLSPREQAIKVTESIRASHLEQKLRRRRRPETSYEVFLHLPGGKRFNVRGSRNTAATWVEKTFLRK